MSALSGSGGAACGTSGTRQRRRARPRPSGPSGSGCSTVDGAPAAWQGGPGIGRSAGLWASGPAVVKGVDVPPEVSVVVPTHNRSGLLALTLRSVLWQRGVDLEVLVEEDGATDD